MNAQRAALDVSALPTVTFRHRSLMWWGTVGFMVIEGWTLLLTVFSYLYVRHSFESWPPPRVPNPDLLIPSLNAVLLLLSLVPACWTVTRAHRLDKRGVLAGLVIGGAMGIVILVLRWFELRALNVRWDSNAYGSVAWLVVGFHTTLLLMDVADTLGLAILLRKPDVPAHFFSDATDNSYYWLFTVVSWLGLFVLVFLGPYVL